MRGEGVTEGVTGDSLRQSRLHRRAAHRALHRRFAGNTHCQLHSCAAIGNFLLNASGSHTPAVPSRTSASYKSLTRSRCSRNAAITSAPKSTSFTHEAAPELPELLVQEEQRTQCLILR